MPLQATSGAASYDAFGGGVAAVPNYIEDVFSTWLYTGNGSTQTITNGIDLAGKGGLVWLKRRDGAVSHILFDTARSTGSGDPFLQTNTTDAQVGATTNYLSYLSNGFSLDSAGSGINGNQDLQASWTFRKQPKFFDVVTYTGNGVAGRTVAHNLGSTPGCILIKKTSAADGWFVYHTSTGKDQYLELNTTNPAYVFNMWNGTAPTATEFSLSARGEVNGSGQTYVAYLFAHNAGGFGLTGTDNVISCGSFTTDGSGNATVDLGYEPQWILLKSSSNTNDWTLVDNMRGWTASGGYADLNPNNANAEDNFLAETFLPLNATGFRAQFTSGNASRTYIYIAIRRGPMKVPTSGTSVFAPVASDAAGGTALTTNFPVDLQMYGVRAGDAANITTSDRLRGVSTTSTAGGNFIVTSSTAAETGGSYTRQWGNTGFVMPAGIGSQDGIFWNFRRAPGFFDEVCYTGDATDPRTINHNLGVAPELIITKQRSATRSWPVRITALGNSVRAFLNLTDAASASASVFPVATYTGSTYVIGSDASVNASGSTYVAYLFASCPGVSKVGSYTGTGTTQVINCGFTGGARFVLIKRTDSTGDWYVWDSARGIVAGNDPYLLLNSTAAEVTSTDYVDTAATGFELSSTAPAALNASGGSYIFLAIA